MYAILKGSMKIIGINAFAIDYFSSFPDGHKPFTLCSCESCDLSIIPLYRMHFSVGTISHVFMTLHDRSVG